MLVVFFKCMRTAVKKSALFTAGDIAAAVGLKDTTTGDTLCDEKNPVILESMNFPDPVIQLAVEPKTKADQDKMGIALQKLAEEDPTFRAHTDEETGQTIIAGMGELHLEILVDRMLREFKVETNVVNHKLLTVKLSVLQRKLKVNSFVNPVVVVNTDIVGLSSNHKKLAQALSSKTKLSADLFLENISHLFKLVSKNP